MAIRDILKAISGATLAAAMSATTADAEPNALETRIASEWAAPHLRAYDFWIGEWSNNWRGYAPGQFHHAREGAAYRHWVFPALGGKILIELAASVEPAAAGPWAGKRYYGMSVRYYDPAKERWVMAQHWPGNVPTPAFLSQLQGFEHFGRVQVFVTGQPDDEGVSRTTRYTFSDIRDGAFRWDGASTTDGRLWRQGSIAEFTRVAEAISWPEKGAPFLTFGDGEICPEPEHRDFDFLEGDWEGEAEIEGQGARAVSLTGYRVLGGCGVFTLLSMDHNGARSEVFTAFGYSPERGEWTVLRIDDRPGTPHAYGFGDIEGGRGEIFRDERFRIEDGLKPIFAASNETDRDGALVKSVWLEAGEARFVVERHVRDRADQEWRRASRLVMSRAD